MLRDACGRTIDYLRIAVTDYCNLRCCYCLPPRSAVPLAHADCLRFEELTAVARAFVGLGGRKLRLTGGEPLRKRNLFRLVEQLAALSPRPELVLTTNGTLLAAQAQALAAAGLQRVNISCDTLRPETFRRITGVDAHAGLLAGIDAALRAGLHPVRLNAVIMRGVNDDEAPALVQFARARGCELRFIEQMPVPGTGFSPVDGAAIRAQLRADGLTLTREAGSDGIAVWYRTDDGQRLGFISAHRHNSCAACSRLRLSFDGCLRPCLYSPYEIDLRPALRRGDDLRPLLQEAVAHKPACGVAAADTCLVRPMLRTGG